MVATTSPQLTPAHVWEMLDADHEAGVAYLARRGLGGARPHVRFATPTSPGTAGYYGRQGWVLACPLRDVRGIVTAIQVRRIDDGEDRFRLLGPSSGGVFG